MSIKISKQQMNGTKQSPNLALQKISPGTMYWCMGVIILRMLLNRI